MKISFWLMKEHEKERATRSMMSASDERQRQMGQMALLGYVQENIIDKKEFFLGLLDLTLAEFFEVERTFYTSETVH